MSSRLSRSVALASLAAAVAVTGVPAVARARARPLFEPTDLELEDTGVVEADLQIGAVRGQGAWRAVLPDFELDFGILPNLELDIDGAYAIEGPATGPFSFDHSAPDSLWPSLKLGLYDGVGEDAAESWALGTQLGPKVPTAAGAHGVGVEGLLLVGLMVRRLHAVLNLGGFVDPAPDAAATRPIGVEAGLDLAIDLGDGGRFSLQGELSGVRFVSSDPNQALATLGFTWSVTHSLDISLSGLVGFLEGSDRYGLLVGLSKKLRFFGREHAAGH